MKFLTFSPWKRTAVQISCPFCHLSPYGSFSIHPGTRIFSGNLYNKSTTNTELWLTYVSILYPLYWPGIETETIKHVLIKDIETIILGSKGGFIYCIKTPKISTSSRLDKKASVRTTIAPIRASEPHGRQLPEADNGMFLLLTDQKLFNNLLTYTRVVSCTVARALIVLLLSSY